MDFIQSGYKIQFPELMLGWFMDYFLGISGLKQSYLVKMSEPVIWRPNFQTRVAKNAWNRR